VFEQLSTPYTKKLLVVMREAVENSAATFDVLYSDLTKMYTEAKDNVKFLMTLERHFKTVQHGSMPAIAEALPSMMNAIRMVWVISRHYNTDERMVPLMERIAQELSDRAVSTINIRTIFRLPPTEIIRTANDAKEVMKKWWDSYFAVRKKIEDNDRDSRWEFDKKRLFDRTSYVSMRLSDIIEAAQTLLDFRSILGPELKAVSGDNARISEIEDCVQAQLLAPIESVPFDMFDRRFQSSWDSIMAKMKLDVVEIEGMIKTFIDSSFKKLRSAEKAFQVLQHFKEIKSREAIERQMSEKFSDIVRQFLKELREMESTGPN
jgi:dynein heavy chain